MESMGKPLNREQWAYQIAEHLTAEKLNFWLSKLS